MTQENKYSYIKELIEELSDECKKEGLALNIQATDGEGFAACSLVGTKKEIGRNLIAQDALIEKQLGIPTDLLKLFGASTKCGCAKCKSGRTSQHTESGTLKDFFEGLAEISKKLREVDINGNENK